MRGYLLLPNEHYCDSTLLLRRVRTCPTPGRILRTRPPAPVIESLKNYAFPFWNFSIESAAHAAAKLAKPVNRFIIVLLVDEYEPSRRCLIVLTFLQCMWSTELVCFGIRAYLVGVTFNASVSVFSSDVD